MKTIKTTFAKALLFFCIAIVLTNCATQSTSTIVGGEYNKINNETDYFVMPYGKVKIPGKWEKTHYNGVSQQQFFVNEDSVSIAIAFGRYNKYEFNKDGSHKGYDFANSFYEWDSKWFVDEHGLKRQFLESDSINNFVVYRIFGPVEKGEIDTYFLVGEKNGNVSNFSISDIDKWTETAKILFLKNLFLND